MIFKVGVTGGIGSGKSLVCKIFRNLEIPVFEADTRAKKLISEDPDIRNELLKQFGQKIFRNAKLDRKFLADRIFSDSEARFRVNALVHPKVRADFRQWLGRQAGPYAVEEAALLFESGAWKEMDLNILVMAREETRIERIMKRDGISRREVLARLASQIDPDDAAKLADIRILNDDDKFLIPQVLEADSIIRKRLKAEYK
jgi:dephospho-CoA kinase